MHAVTHAEPLPLPTQGRLRFFVPESEQAAFAEEVKGEERLRVLRLLAALEKIHQSTNKLGMAELLARQLNERGMSEKRLRTLYYQFVKGHNGHPRGSWRILARHPKREDRGLPAKFIPFWRALCEEHQRTTASAWKELRDIIRTGRRWDGALIKALPGFDHWPDVCPHTGMPPGMTYANLARLAPDAHDLAASRLGPAAAANMGFKISTTRVGLRVLQHIQPDDHEFNVQVLFAGQRKAMRPRCFGFADVLCSHTFSLACKPTLWDAEEEVKKALTETDFLWSLLDVLCSVGYRTDEHGTTFFIEWGTATVRKETRELISKICGGHVNWELSGRFHRPAHGGQFAPPSGGNPRHKAIIEGTWRMVDDALDSLPGQVGKDRLHAPEELERADRYAVKLLTAAELLPTELAAQLRFNRLTWNQFTALLYAATGRIADETQHAVADWERCGFTVREVRAALDSPRWLALGDVDALPEAERAALVARVEQNPELDRVRLMSRREAYTAALAADRHLIRRLPLTALPDIVGLRRALRGGEPLTVREGRLSFEDWRIGPGEHAFLALGLDGQPLREFSRWICFVNPINPSALIACDEQLRVVGVCAPVLRPSTADNEGIARALGVQAHWKALKDAPRRARHAEAAEDMEFLKQHNRALLDQLHPQRQRVGQAPDLVPASIPEVDIGALVRQRAEQFTPEPEVAWES